MRSNPSTMRVAAYTRTGAARDVLKVTERPVPDVGAGEVRVRLEVSGVNPTDVKRRAAAPGAALPWAEQIPHQDGAGTIDAVGTGVDTTRIGQRVWVYHAAWDRPAGTAAEFVTVPARQAVTLPDTASFAQGAGLGIPYITAYGALFSQGPGLTGRTVLVTGGAGAVGNAAIQLATWAGARVVTTVSSQEKAELALAAGADVAVDYTADDAEAALTEAAGAGIDHVVDVALVANIDSYVRHLRRDAQIVAYTSEPGAPSSLPTRELMTRNALVRFLLVYHLPEHVLAAACEAIVAGLQAHVLTPLPEHHVPLEEIAAAHEAVEANVTGKVLVDLA